MLAGFLWTVQAFAGAPSNDDFDHPTTVTAFPFDDVLDVQDATAAEDDPTSCSSSRGASVWYAVTVPERSRISFDTSGSTYQPFLSVFTGSRGSLVAVTCGFSPGSFRALPGETYHVMVQPGGGSVSEELRIRFVAAPAPPNDDFDHALPVTILPFANSADTSGATTDPDDPSCGGNAASIWYTLTVTEPALIKANTGDADYRATVSVYTGTRGNLQLVRRAEE